MLNSAAHISSPGDMQATLCVHWRWQLIYLTPHNPTGCLQMHSRRWKKRLRSISTTALLKLCPILLEVSKRLVHTFAVMLARIKEYITLLCYAFTTYCVVWELICCSHGWRPHLVLHDKGSLWKHFLSLIACYCWCQRCHSTPNVIQCKSQAGV